MSLALKHVPTDVFLSYLYFWSKFNSNNTYNNTFISKRDEV